MLVDAALGFINHLLIAEEWPRDRLKPFAGQTARLESGALFLSLEITRDGIFIPGNNKALAAVCITLPADAPLRALTDRTSLMAAAHISGSAELAETLSFISRNLRWDVESDLSPLLGDIAARRLVEGGKYVATSHMKQAKNLALNLAEYFTQENPSLACRQDVSSFCADIDCLQQTLTQLESRIALLEGC